MITTNLRKDYKGLSHDEILDKAHELGMNYQKYSGSCSQCVVAALHTLIEMDDMVVRVADSSCGGQVGQVIGTCGALIGGTMALDYFFGHPAHKMSHQEGVPGNLELHIDAVATATPLFYKFIEQYGTTICPQIMLQLFGRHYYFLDDEEMEKFEKAGGHKDKCNNVVGNAARWTMKILLDKGVIKM